MKETGEDILDDIIAEDVAHAATIRFTTFDGAKVLLTVDPANLQAVVSLQSRISMHIFIPEKRSYHMKWI